MQTVEAPMNMGEAVSAICLYLQWQNIPFRLASTQIIDAQHYEVSVYQIYPEQRLVTYQITAEESPDCWKIEEKAT